MSEEATEETSRPKVIVVMPARQAAATLKATFDEIPGTRSTR